MQESIRQFFLFDYNYQGAITLYMQYGTKQGLQKQLNLRAHNMDLQLILFEELRIIAEIPDQTFKFMMNIPVKPMPVVRE